MRQFVWQLTMSLAIAVSACSGNDGRDGEAGAPGADAVDRGAIAGQVVDGTGTPVSGVSIKTDPDTSSATTSADGRFMLPNIPVGGYTIIAVSPNAGSAQLLTGVAGGQTTNVRLTLVAAPAGVFGKVSGRVIGPTGLGIDGASVTVDGQSATAITATDGSFSLTGVEPGFIYLSVATPNNLYLNGETRSSVLVRADQAVNGITITLSGRPGATATAVGSKVCLVCHSRMPNGQDLNMAFDGSSDSAAHSRFIVEGTGQMVYPELWPTPGEALLPRDPKGKLLMVQDPQDGKGLVNVVLCTRDGASGAREYLFKFYPQLGTDAAPISRTDTELDCSGSTGDIFAWKALQDAGTYDPSAQALFIPVAATIGGQGNWGEGWRDPQHLLPDRHPNFGEGKQRYMCRMQDAPYTRQWAKNNGVTSWLRDDYVDYISYMPVYIMQDGTARGSDALALGDVGTPKFWQKSPSKWIYPANTLSRNCAGCHATGARLVKKDFADYKEVVVDWQYVDLNVGCERCHGPGSQHAFTTDTTKIINPKYLTAKAADETCGQCHGAHGGKSERPLGIHKYPFDANHEQALGNGFFVPGIYDIENFYYKFDEAVPTVADDWTKGTFHSWPDETHSRAHSQMLSETRRSVHSNNSFEKVTCFSCHDSHSLDGGPDDASTEGYAFQNAAFDNNALCFTCHATHGDFEAVTKADVAVLQIDAGRTATLDGNAVTVSSSEASLARNRVARAVAGHMQSRAGMGGALYTPTDALSPTGNCASCHMPKIGKLQDVNDDAQWHLKRDSNGLSAVAEGNVPSHVFDIVWPGQSSVLKPMATHDYEIMPNSCSNCHAFARISGDAD